MRMHETITLAASIMTLNVVAWNFPGTTVDFLAPAITSALIAAFFLWYANKEEKKK